MLVIAVLLAGRRVKGFVCFHLGLGKAGATEQAKEVTLWGAAFCNSFLCIFVTRKQFRGSYAATQHVDSVVYKKRLN
jgi:hypothetical protein